MAQYLTVLIDGFCPLNETSPPIPRRHQSTSIIISSAKHPPFVSHRIVLVSNSSNPSSNFSVRQRLPQRPTPSPHFQHLNPTKAKLSIYHPNIPMSLSFSPSQTQTQQHPLLFQTFYFFTLYHHIY